MTRVRRYEGEHVVVTYDARRCIHAAECVHGLPGVFDTAARPWIQPGKTDASRVLEVVARCPTGALHAHPKDGPGEIPDPQASIREVVDGPLHVRGRIEIVDHEGNVVATDTRVALCRCGASKNKPFCDNSHEQTGFRSREAP